MKEFETKMHIKALKDKEKKNKFKGQKCELKPTSMDIHITFKNLQLSQNYFDHSQQIIEEQQKQQEKQMQKITALGS